MVQVVRKKRETILSLLKRFNRKVQQSGNLLRFKTIQHQARHKSDLKKKKEALIRTRRAKKMQKLYKLGKIELPRT